MNPLTTLMQTLPALTEALGPKARTTLYDLRSTVPVVVAAYGTLAESSGVSAVSDLAALVGTGATAEIPPKLVTTARGRTIRSAWTFVSDESIPVGALHIEVDVTIWAEFGSYESWHRATPASGGARSVEQPNSDMEELRAELVRAALDRIGVPVGLLLKNHKLAIVRELDSNGFFLLRESVPYLAASLSVSRHSIYNYLNDIRGLNASAR